MKFDEIVEKISKIARINLSEEEKKRFSKEIENVLEAFSEIDKINANVEPTFHPVESEYELREDVPEKFEIDPFENIIKENIEITKDGKYMKGPKIL